jgi:hypothetical protein
MDIPIDARVLRSDGLGGRSTLVIINSTARKITNIVVKERQDPHTERLVPIRYVVDFGRALLFAVRSRRKSPASARVPTVTKSPVGVSAVSYIVSPPAFCGHSQAPAGQSRPTHYCLLRLIPGVV